MHILAVKTSDNVQKLAQLWVTGTIERAFLSFLENVKFQTWTIKVDVNQAQTTALESRLQQYDILNISTWTAKTPLGISTTFKHVSHQLNAMAIDNETNEKDNTIKAEDSIVATLRSKCNWLI